jgi:hypothetical protein
MRGKFIALYHQREPWPAQPSQGHEVTAAQFDSPPAAGFRFANRDALVAAIGGKIRAPRIRQPPLNRAQPCRTQALAVATYSSGDPRFFAVSLEFHALHVTRYM